VRVIRRLRLQTRESVLLILRRNHLSLFFFKKEEEEEGADKKTKLPSPRIWALQ